MFIDSSEDEYEYVPQGVTKTSDNLETPRNVSPQLCPKNIIDNPPILQPDQIKLQIAKTINNPKYEVNPRKLINSFPVLGRGQS